MPEVSEVSEARCRSCQAAPPARGPLCEQCYAGLCDDLEQFFTWCLYTKPDRWDYYVSFRSIIRSWFCPQDEDSLVSAN